MQADQGCRLARGLLPTAAVVHHIGKSSEQAVTAHHINCNRAKLRYFRKHHGYWTYIFLRVAILKQYLFQNRRWQNALWDTNGNCVSSVFVLIGACSKQACLLRLLSCQVICGQETSYSARDGRISTHAQVVSARSRANWRKNWHSSDADIWIITDGQLAHLMSPCAAPEVCRPAAA